MTASGTWQSWSARAVDCRGMRRRDRANGNERQGNFSLWGIFHAGRSSSMSTADTGRAGGENHGGLNCSVVNAMGPHAHSCGLQGARLETGDAAAHDLLSAFAATLRG